MKKIFLILAILVSGCSTMEAPENRVVLKDTAITMGILTAYGVSEWEWFQHSPEFKKEGWFEKDSHAGGADKTGHAYVSYILNEALTYDFKRNNVANAENKAALASLASMTLIEIGDATSKKHGFSGEDLIADAIGVGASWWLQKNPKWDDRIDFRMEYKPSPGYPGGFGPAADYSGMKHLLALKGSGFNSLRNTPLEFLELYAGYYTRGFRSYDKGHYDEPERNTYLGLGLNLSRVLGKTAPKVGKFFEYYQVPGTYLEKTGTF